MARDLQKASVDGTLEALIRRIEALERNGRLGTSSIREGTLEVQDSTGAARVRLGVLPSGLYGLQIISDLGGGVFVDNDIIGSTYNADEQEDNASGTRTTNTYGDLSGAPVGPACSIPVSSRGKVLVVAGAKITHFNTLSTDGHVGFELSGANTLAAADTRAANLLVTVAANATIAATVATVRLLTGLNAGITVFTSRYRGDGTTVSTFDLRYIFAIPL